MNSECKPKPSLNLKSYTLNPEALPACLGVGKYSLVETRFASHLCALFFYLRTAAVVVRLRKLLEDVCNR